MGDVFPLANSIFPANGGEMAALMRAKDWSETALGSIEIWPQSLRTAVSIALQSRFPMLIWWGAEMVKLYNDAYRLLLGTKHPASLGARGRDVWPEIWSIIGPMLEGVLERGEATWSDDQLLLLARNGYLEECYLTFSYSPINDESGGIGGIFTAVTETTDQVLSRRRLAVLTELAINTADAKTPEAACERAAATVAAHPLDIPFALLYMLADGGLQARLVSAANMNRGLLASPESIDLAEPAIWPFAESIQSKEPILIENLAEQFGALPDGAWGVPPEQALILPLIRTNQELPYGFLVAAISPRRRLDDEYRGFLSLVAGQITTSIANAKAYEEERQRAEALAELDSAKTQFFSNVSHEFRTPLTLILDPIQSLLHGTLTQPQRESLELINRNSLRLLKLVNTLLDFARIEANRVEVAYELTDLSALTLDLASVFRSAIERAGLIYEVDCPPLPEAVYVDRDMWEKIVLNLLSNAFKFTFEGSIRLSLRWQGDHVALEVCDTGIGIAESDLSHLFERFYRVHNARARTYEGTGIGLSLVQVVTQLQGGAVTVQSTLGVGTCFTVSLPTGSAHLTPEQINHRRTLTTTATGVAAYLEEMAHWLPDGEMPQSIEPYNALPLMSLPDIANMKILLVDDNADMRFYLTRLLTGQGWQVQAYSDGASAFMGALTYQPDLILSDVMMPGLDGFSLIQALRGDLRTRTIPIILLSARAGEEARVEGLEAGADTYLVKPFSVRELIATVNSHLVPAQLRQEIRHVEQEYTEALHQTLQKMEQSNALLNTLLESPPIGLAFVDRDLHYLHINKTLARLNRRSVADHIGKSIDEVVPSMANSIRPMLQRVLERGEQILDQEIVGQDPEQQREQNYMVSYYPVETESGERIGVGLLALNVTERRIIDRQQAFLIELNDRLRALAEPEAIMEAVSAALGRYLNVNRSMYVEIQHDQEYFYIAPYNYVNGVESVVGVLRLDDFGPEVIQALRSGNTVVPDDVLTDPRTKAFNAAYDAIQLRAFLAVPLIKHGKFVALFVQHSKTPRQWWPDEIALVEQVAERTWLALENARTQRALRESEGRYRELIELSPDAMFVNVQDQIVYANQATFKLLRADKPEQVIGQSPYVFIAPESTSLAQEHIHRLLATGESNGLIEQRWVRLDHSAFDVEVVAAPIIWQGNTGIQVIVRDITERQRLLDSEQAARLTAEQALQARNEFLSVAAHELKTPVTSLRGFAQLLLRQLNKRGTVDPAQLQRALETIDQQSAKLSILLTQLLDLSRLEAGKLTLNRLNIDMVQLVGNVVANAQRTTGLHNLILDVPATLVVSVDPIRIEQVIVNLVENAIKYSPEGGDILVSLTTDASALHLSVTDHGLGIPPERRELIFERFYQAHGAGFLGGMGLGLYISRQIVDLHGGQIRAEFPDEGGTRFIVSLPLHQ